MRDRRSVDDLSIEELEHILRIRRREARLARLRRLEHHGRRRGDLPLPEVESPAHLAAGEPAPEVPHSSFVYGRHPNPLRERLLLAIEIAAVVGLLAVLVFAVFTLRAINRESARAQAGQVAALPTPSATPLLSAVVLPGGHTPPIGPEGALPNYAEVPAHLRPIVEQQYAGPVVVPTPGPADPIRIRIPAIGVDAPVVQGDGWEQLQRGVGQHLGSGRPGEAGNLVLSAHNDIYGEIFRHLDELEPGDEIIIETQRQAFVYRVLYWRIVEPTDVSVMDPTPDPIVTLISCYPYLVNSHRIVVVGELSR